MSVRRKIIEFCKLYVFLVWISLWTDRKTEKSILTQWMQAEDAKKQNLFIIQLAKPKFRFVYQFLLENTYSYTSKSSFIDNDILPEYKAEQPYLGKFSGKRIHRGLYQSANGIVINADVNGSANIGRKCKQNFTIEELSGGLLASPKRIRVA